MTWRRPFPHAPWLRALRVTLWLGALALCLWMGLVWSWHWALQRRLDAVADAINRREWARVASLLDVPPPADPDALTSRLGQVAAAPLAYQRLDACEANLQGLGDAATRYQRDYGAPPPHLAFLVPQYFPTLPLCPTVDGSIEYEYVPRDDSGSFLIRCPARLGHSPVGQVPGWPRYVGGRGLEAKPVPGPGAPLWRIRRIQVTVPDLWGPFSREVQAVVVEEDVQRGLVVQESSVFRVRWNWGWHIVGPTLQESWLLSQPPGIPAEAAEEILLYREGVLPAVYRWLAGQGGGGAGQK